MPMKTLLSLALILVAAFSFPLPLAAAGGGTIQGTVKDSQTGELLPAANISLAGTGLGTTTDIFGKFVVRNVPPGTYTMRVAYIGYTTLEVHVEVADEATITENVKLDNVGLKAEGVVVTAQAAGQNQAINTQLSSLEIKNVVSAARIQELPDANAAESVGRLPGVSILRSGGEGNEVVVRGLQPKYNAILIDGVRIASSSTDDRSTDLSMISSDMLEGIEVSKSVTADQDADVLGGTVNFRMRQAGESVPGVGVNFLAQLGYKGLSNAYNKFNNYKYVGGLEGRLFDNQLGFFAQADAERRNLASNEFGATYTHLGSSTTNYITQILNLNDVPRDRERTNGTIVLDYRLPAGTVTLTNFGSSGVTDIQNRGESFDIQQNLHNYNVGFSRSTLSVMTNILNLDQQLPIFHANLRLSHTYSETKNPDDWNVGFQQASAGLSQFLNATNLDPHAIVKAANNDTNATYLSTLTTSSSFARERALTVALDLDTPVDLFGLFPTVIKFGGKYRYQTRSSSSDRSSGQGLGLASARYVDNLIANHFPATEQYANTSNLPISPFVDPRYNYGTFLGGDYRMILPLNVAMLAEMARFVKANTALIAENDAIAYFHDDYQSTSFDYAGHEDQSAAYVMATFNLGPEITFIPGVRYQELRTTYTAPRGIENTASATGGPYMHYDTTVTLRHGYWLPDASLRYKPLSWFDIRLSYSNTLAYPDYNAIVPRIDISTSSTIAWNNFKLVPSRSRNYDIYLSFYDNTIGLFTAGGFLKEIDNLIYGWSFYVSGAAALPYYPPQYTGSSTPQGVYNLSTYVNDPYRVKDYGLELDWQTHFWYLPHPFDGLVFNANYTHVYSRAQYPYTEARKVGRVIVYIDTSFTDRLLYQPDNILNVSIGYDFEGFSVRLSMLFQDHIFTGPNYWPQLRTSTAAYRRWDLSAKQDLPWFGLQLFGSLSNLNSAHDVSLIQGSGFPQSEQSYGLTADLGLRWRL